jgi:iron(III) transport system substrate-binding protein
MKKTLTALSLALLAVTAAQAQEKVLNLYSARHYQTDERLYENFTKQTGIKINRIEGKEDELMERLRNEGANSPADVFITVDATRLAVADSYGLFAPVKSKLLESRIPAHLHTDTWFAFSTRARVIIYNRSAVKAEDVQTYASLADPKLKGKVCSRSGAHPYNLSLVASLIAHDGEAKTEEWAKGVVANFARAPKGGDTDQIKAVASGECDIGVTNSYYLARMMRSNKPEDVAVVNKVGVVFPNQASWGTHLNIAGGAVAKHAKNKENAVKFLEYLASPEAQNYFANGNNEWPAVKSVTLDNPALKAMTGNAPFKSETIPISAVGANVTKVQQMLDRVGFQ